MSATDGFVFNFGEMPYVEAIWFVAYKDTDWMAVAWRDDVWHLRYRFRYYNSDEPWDFTDKKNVYEMVLKTGDEAARLKMHQATDMIADLTVATHRGKKWKVIVQGDADRAARLLRQQPWCHTKVTAPGPAGAQ